MEETPKRKKKTGLFIGLGVGLVAAAVVVALVLSKNPKSNADTEAFEKCFSISDYRSYMNTYGTKGLHYNEAKNVIDRYVADSTAKADAKERDRLAAETQERDRYNKCTTIEECDKYLKDYPQGKYVKEVKAKKAELEKKAAEEAKKKEAVEKKNQQTNSKNVKIVPKKDPKIVNGGGGTSGIKNKKN